MVEELISQIPVPPEPLVPLTMYDCCVGHPDNYLINGKDYTKSVGPFNGMRKIGKNDCFTQDETSFTVSDSVLERMAELEDLFREGKIPWLHSRATRKDEVVSEEHQRIHKNRLFYVSEVEFNFLLKKYLKPLQVWFTITTK